MYALQKRSTFKHTEPGEISKLIGVHILMGVIKLPQIRMYWNSTLKTDSISSCKYDEESILSTSSKFALDQHHHIQLSRQIYQSTSNNCSRNFTSHKE